MNLLEITSKFCERVGISQPAVVVGSTNPQILQIKALLEEEINDLISRHYWEALTREATFTTVATEDQGNINTIATEGFRAFLNNTFWDRNDRLPCALLDAQQWQTIKGFSNIGIRWKFRLRGDNLLIAPIPPVGHTWAFEYLSRWGILDNGTGLFKEFFTDDSDTTVLPDSIHLQGIRWRWLREKGLDYAELFNTYELQVKDLMARDGGAPNINMNTGYHIRQAQAPQGSWFT